MIDVILLPLDGSDLAEATLPFAAAMQRAFSSKLILLRVVGDGEDAGDSVEWRLRQAEARNYLEAVVDDLAGQGIEAEAIVTAGKACEAILEVIREQNADLVLLTSHGAGGPSQFEVSGTAHKVLSAATTSVLLVRVAGGVPSTEKAALKTVLVPMDGSQRSEWALCLAASVARANGAELILLWVLPRPEAVLPGSGGAEIEALLEASRKNAENRMKGWVSQLVSPELTVKTRVLVAASIPRAIDEFAVQEKVSLTVLSAHGGAPDDGWPYGSVSGAVLHHGTTPVLVFQDAPSRASKNPRQRRSQRRRSRPNHQGWTR